MRGQQEQLEVALGLEQLRHCLASNARTAKWCRTLDASIRCSLDGTRNGNLPRWLDAFQHLPEIAITNTFLDTAAVTASGQVSGDQRQQLHAALRQLHPWRKGPFDICGLFIDSEWRSDWKWNRLAPHLDLQGHSILDVGCGNGYFGWRMLAAGAAVVIGLDPMILYTLQHAALRKYLGNRPNFVVPGSDQLIADPLAAFDTVFSMGVLYHRTSPIDHLLALARALRPQGQLVLETLIIDPTGEEVLVPKHRYAKMRNVWFIPSVGMLTKWLQRCGFTDVRCIDQTTTTVDEQRATAWMTFESLPEFLDSQDPKRTVEGYPAPLRAILLARKH